MGTYSVTANVGKCGAWCIVGPFVGFRHTADNGKSWVEPRYEMAKNFSTYKASDNLFSELGPVCSVPMKFEDGILFCPGKKWKGKISMGTPHVVDLGPELKYSPDAVKRAYVTAHGVAHDEEHLPNSFFQGSGVYMARTKSEVSPEVMNDGSQWEFFSGYEEGSKAKWADDVSNAKPLFRWENRTGTTTVSYFKPLNKYIMSVTVLTYPVLSKPVEKPSDVYFLESDSITGPYKLIKYISKFGPAGYFYNFPTSFITGNTNVAEAQLTYSANWLASKSIDGFPIIKGAGYKPLLTPIRFLRRF